MRCVALSKKAKSHPLKASHFLFRSADALSFLVRINVHPRLETKLGRSRAYSLLSATRASFFGKEASSSDSGSATITFAADTKVLYRASIFPRATLSWDQPFHFYKDIVSNACEFDAVSNDKKYHDRGVLPDYPISHTIEDLIAGR